MIRKKFRIDCTFKIEVGESQSRIDGLRVVGMKLLSSILLGLLDDGSAPAQNPRVVSVDTSSNVTVMKIRSHQVVSVPGLYDDPMRINQERDDLEHDQK